MHEVNRLTHLSCVRSPPGSQYTVQVPVYRYCTLEYCTGTVQVLFYSYRYRQASGRSASFLLMIHSRIRRTSQVWKPRTVDPTNSASKFSTAKSSQRSCREDYFALARRRSRGSHGSLPASFARSKNPNPNLYCCEPSLFYEFSIFSWKIDLLHRPSTSKRVVVKAKITVHYNRQWHYEISVCSPDLSIEDCRRKRKGSLPSPGFFSSFF